MSIRERWKQIDLFDKCATGFTLLALALALFFYLKLHTGLFKPKQVPKATPPPVTKVIKKKPTYQLYTVGEGEYLPWTIVNRFFPNASVSEKRQYCTVLKRMNPEIYKNIKPGVKIKIPPNWKLRSQ
ncbi:MAG TPA: hypothetical protein EYP60_06405 [bacterium (Candidatus Stahlbacteria)]|nr:hypothetical protein [Candidatus Stahlbacteria bacterium]